MCINAPGSGREREKFRGNVLALCLDVFCLNTCLNKTQLYLLYSLFKSCRYGDPTDKM